MTPGSTSLRLSVAENSNGLPPREVPVPMGLSRHDISVGGGGLVFRVRLEEGAADGSIGAHPFNLVLGEIVHSMTAFGGTCGSCWLDLPRGSAASAL